MANHPVVVLAPGMCCVGSLVFQPLIAELSSRGWETNDLIPVDNPSVDASTRGNSLKPNGLEVDVQHLRQIFTKLIESEGRDVLIVAHSYSGTPSLCAADGLWKHQRASRGQKGGIIRAALISASLTSPGGTIAGERMQWQAANNIPLDARSTFEVDGELYLDPTGFDAFWYNDIDQSRWKDYELKPSPMTTVLTPVRDDIDCKSWRISYLVLTELDYAMPEPLQRHLIHKAQDLGAEVDSIPLNSGHFPQISHPKEVAQWLQSLVSAV